MTNEAINVAIAKACGWRYERDADYLWLIEPGGTRRVGHSLKTTGEPWEEDARLMPDYFNDVAAMHEARGKLSEAQRARMARELHQLMLQENGVDPEADALDATSATLDAPAKWLAEAFVRALDAEGGPADDSVTACNRVKAVVLYAQKDASPDHQPVRLPDGSVLFLRAQLVDDDPVFALDHALARPDEVILNSMPHPGGELHEAEEQPTDDPQAKPRYVQLSRDYTLVDMPHEARKRAVRCAHYRTLSPHEWTWTADEQQLMALFVLWATQRLEMANHVVSGAPVGKGN